MSTNWTKGALGLALVGISCGGAKGAAKAPSAPGQPGQIEAAGGLGVEAQEPAPAAEAPTAEPAAPSEVAKVEAPKAVEPAPAAPAKLPPQAKGPPPSQHLAEAKKALKAGNHDQAIRSAKAALKRDERYVPAMIVLAKVYYQQKKYELATEIIGTANGIDKANAEAYQLLGFIQLAQEDEPRALASFKKATELKPDFAYAWLNLGAQYLQAKNYNDAKNALERAVDLAPKLPRAQLNLGSAYRGVGEYAKADAAYRVALKLVPTYAEAHFNLGILYLDAPQFPGMDTMQRLSEAIRQFNRYKELKSSRLAKNDPVDSYIEEARKGLEREQKRIEREKQKAVKQAAPKAGEPPAKKDTK